MVSADLGVDNEIDNSNIGNKKQLISISKMWASRDNI